MLGIAGNGFAMVLMIFSALLRGVVTPDSNLESGPGTHAKLLLDAH